MTPLKLNTLETCKSIFEIAARSIAPVLLLLASSTFCQSALGQNIQPRPVARLVSDPSVAAGLSRPRRVKAEDSFPIEAARSASSALDDASAVERRAFDQTNMARLESGLQPLNWDADLYRLAKAHSQQMAQQGLLSHKTPEGLQLKERAQANRIRFRVIGENIAYNKGYDDPGGFAVERWLISSGHRANILYAGFQASAIGSFVSADGSTYLTQVFITR